MPNTETSRVPIALTSTVNDVLRDYPATGAIFNAYGVDTCCRAELRVLEAAAESGVDAEILLAMLEEHARPEFNAAPGVAR